MVYVWPWLNAMDGTSAFTALTALRNRLGFAIALVWLTNVVCLGHLPGKRRRVR